ncbi:MAG: GEVED domain-containing protein, partial [Bacteroidetes bacterium]|nr:GEVED domain-containing protein [Bacteroidota bacterium]
MSLFILLFVIISSIKVFGQTATINATGTLGSYITGSVNAAGLKNDGDMINLSSTSNKGWATFDLSSIPANALITDVTLNFTTTSASVSSGAINYIYGFSGNPATMSGTTLYNSIGAGISIDASTWIAGNINTIVLGATSLSFFQTNIGQTQVNFGFERGGLNMYHINGYGAASSQQPQLVITYVLQTNCIGTPAPGTTVSSLPNACSSSALDLSLQNSFIGQYGITYQWQTSSNGTTFVNSLYDTLAVFSTTQSSTTYYQCIVGCSFTSNSAISSAIQVSQNGPTSCYCASSAVVTGNQEIFGVQFGLLNNTSDCSTTAPGAGSINQQYSNYTTLAPASFTKGLAYNLGVTINTCGGFWGEDLAVFIDFNQDGDYLDSGENVYTSPYSIGVANAVRGNIVTIPCDAVLGNTGMRVVYTEGGGSASCGTYGYGETEDYLINILGSPLSYNNSAAIQQTGFVAPGFNDRAILRVPVAMSGCGVATATNFIFNTSGTNNVGDIANAKLYRTDNNKTFSTTKLLASIAAPSGAIVFTVNDTLLNNDTTNYWLAYDINVGATLANVVDARFDSIKILGAYRIPFVSNPSGNVTINSPMTFVSADATQALLAKVESGTTNNRILGMEVVTSATGASINVTQFELSTNGTTDTSNIRNIKVWYTGNSSTFATSNQFGTTLPLLPTAATFSITGTQGLNNGTNYFWLTYDVSNTATVGNYIDAEFISATVAGTSQIPSTSAPSGSRQIRAPYCASSATSAFDEEIFGVQLGSLSNTSTCSSIATGAGSISQLYSNYTTLTPIDFTRGITYPLGVTINTCGGFWGEDLAVFIDYNQDGDFLDAGENIYTSPFTTGSANLVLGANIIIPCYASLGETRMRVVYTEGGGSTSCGTYDYGETEDYLINILG